MILLSQHPHSITLNCVADGGQNNDPQDDHILIPERYQYITFHHKRDFVNVIKLMALAWEIILNYCVGPA